LPDFGSKGSGDLIPAADAIDRWYPLLRTLGRRAETSGFLGFAGRPAAPIRALGTSQALVPLV
jgi:hypothetical protein